MIPQCAAILHAAVPPPSAANITCFRLPSSLPCVPSWSQQVAAAEAASGAAAAAVEAARAEAEAAKNECVKLRGELRSSEATAREANGI